MDKKLRVSDKTKSALAAAEQRQVNPHHHRLPALGRFHCRGALITPNILNLARFILPGFFNFFLLVKNARLVLPLLQPFVVLQG